MSTLSECRSCVINMYICFHYHKTETHMAKSCSPEAVLVDAGMWMSDQSFIISKTIWEKNWTEIKFNVNVNSAFARFFPLVTSQISAVFGEFR